MGGRFYGGDLDQLMSLGTSFTNEAGAVDSLRGRIQSTLDSTQWTGPAADRFREQWTGDFVPALQRLMDALNEGATVVNQRRDAIEAATGLAG